MMGSGPSTSATSSWREETAASAFRGVSRYGPAPHRRPTGLRAMRHHAAAASGGRQGRSALFSPHSGHHQRESQQVSPMFPVNSVTYVPGCTVSPSLYDVVRSHQQRLRDRKPERAGGLQVDDQLEARRLLDRQVARISTL